MKRKKPARSDSRLLCLLKRFYPLKMTGNVLVYWHGIIGVPGKGPNWTEKYNPNRTLGQIARDMEAHGFGERNKKIKMFKFQPGDLSKYNAGDPYWSDDTKLSEYVKAMGGQISHGVHLIYHIVA